MQNLLRHTDGCGDGVADGEPYKIHILSQPAKFEFHSSCTIMEKT